MNISKGLLTIATSAKVIATHGQGHEVIKIASLPLVLSISRLSLTNHQLCWGSLFVRMEIFGIPIYTKEEKQEIGGWHLALKSATPYQDDWLLVFSCSVATNPVSRYFIGNASPKISIKSLIFLRKPLLACNKRKDILANGRCY